MNENCKQKIALNLFWPRIEKTKQKQAHISPAALSPNTQNIPKLITTQSDDVVKCEMHMPTFYQVDILLGQ